MSEMTADTTRRPAQPAGVASGAGPRAGSRPLRSLLVTGIEPWGSFGGPMRVRLAARTLAAMGPVDLILLTWWPDPAVPRAGGLFRRIHIGRLEDLRPGGIALNTFLGRRGAVMERFRQRILAGEWPEWAAPSDYDLVWYNREQSWLQARPPADQPRPASIVDVDDRLDVVLARSAALRRTDSGERLWPWLRLRMAREERWWRSVHRRCAQDNDVVLFASEHDADAVAVPNAMVVPNAFELPAAPVGAAGRTGRVDGPPVILFQGFFRWWPNIDGSLWLCREILPRIRERVPDVRLILAGDASREVQALGRLPGVELAGQVADMTPYMRQAAVVAVPLRVGSGTRIKILEAFAHRVPVVSTTIGAEGLSVVPGVHCDVADTVEAFAESCSRLLVDRDRARQLVTAAAALHRQDYTPAQAGQKISEAVQVALAAARSRTAAAPGPAA